MANDLIPQLLLLTGGAVSAAALDRAKPDWNMYLLGPKGDPNAVTITPGAMAAAGSLLVLTLMPGSASAFQKGLATAASGAFVYEGTKLAEQKLLPQLDSLFKPAAPAPMPMMVSGSPYGMMGGYPYAADPYCSQYDYVQAMNAYRPAA